MKVLRRRAARSFLDELKFNSKYPFDIIPDYMLKEVWILIDKNNHPDYRIQWLNGKMIKFKR